MAKQKLPRNSVIQSNQIQRDAHDDIEVDYVSTDFAKQATGFGSTKLLKWAQTHNVRHLKHRGDWRFHQRDLLTALQSGPLPAPSLSNEPGDSAST